MIMNPPTQEKEIKHLIEACLTIIEALLVEINPISLQLAIGAIKKSPNGINQEEWDALINKIFAWYKHKQSGHPFYSFDL